MYAEEFDSQARHLGNTPQALSHLALISAATFLDPQIEWGENRVATLKNVRTRMLDIAYETHGPDDGEPVILLHGFPYDPRSYDAIAPVLGERGYRVLVPYLRGYGPTRFIDDRVMRSGQQAALAKDLLDFMDELAITQATLAGYDWGGRAACIVAALWPERVRGLVTGDGYNIQDIAKSLKPRPPETGTSVVVPILLPHPAWRGRFDRQPARAVQAVVVVVVALMGPRDRCCMTRPRLRSTTRILSRW